MNITRARMQVLWLAAGLAFCATASLSFAQTPAGTPKPGGSKADYQKFALLQEGDSVAGKGLFFDNQRLACSRCHSVDGAGGKPGPDLSAIGDKFGRRELIEAILTPSATIAVGYSTTTIETKAGDEYQGILKQATDSFVELMGSDAKPVRVANADIKARRTSDVSLMPEGLQAGLSPKEFNDVVEYLVSLRLPENSNLTAHGMPTAITELTPAIGFRSFHDETNRFDHPVWFGQVPGLLDTFMVVEHETGRICLLEKHLDGDIKAVFVELGKFQTGTRGLIGITLHPRFRENRKYYTAQSTVENGKFSTIISEREAALDFKHDSGSPSRLIVKLEAVTNVHYGGGLAFGPDGFLYIGMGDSGPQEDPEGHAQNLGLLLGKMLRVDVDHPGKDLPYSIPTDNPFIGQANARPEIWAYGLREPWRFSFDAVTHDLWVGDVGQDRYEEVDILRRGENYGWNVFEGFERFSNRYRQEGRQYVPPVFAYNRKYGPSVTGGFVYRGNPQSSFYGVYIFGDYQTRRIWGMTQENRALKKIRQLGVAPERVTAFGLDAKGEIYIAGYDGTISALDLTTTKFE